MIDVKEINARLACEGLTRADGASSTPSLCLIVVCLASKQKTGQNTTLLAFFEH